MNKKKLYWIFQIAGWLLYALLNLFILSIAEKFEGKIALSWLFQTAFLITISHFLRNIIVKRGWLKLLIKDLIPRVLGAVLICSAITYIFTIGISIQLDLVDYNRDFNTIFIILNILTFFVLFLFWAIIYFMYHYVENYNSNLRYEAAMNEIELNKLKSQLNPHFIFNALNSIRALVNENPAKAKTAITQLSNILRNSLIMDKQRLIRFSEEIQTVKDYLDLETIRFEERLKVQFDLHPKSDLFFVPPLMIQTLVENGIKHGISNLTAGGWLIIRTQVENSRLHIMIRNSGQFRKFRSTMGSGFGLENTKQRLKLIYGEEASFHIANDGPEYVMTEVIVPQKI